MVIEQGSSPAAAGKFLQEVVIGREDYGRWGNGILLIPDERRPIRLHRAIEAVELRVLAKALGIDPCGLGVGLGANDLGPLGALGADRACLLLAVGLHPFERR